MARREPTDLVSLGRMQVSRLIVGHNPVCGNSHASPEMTNDMRQYFTSENVVAMYQHAEKLGIKTVLVRGDYQRLSHLELYRRAGGKMNVLCQTASEMHDVFQNIRVIAAAGAQGIYHHGTQTDRFWLSGQIERTKDYLKCMRDCGVSVGLASHVPEVFDYALQHDWDVDFYMCCFYNPGKGQMRQSALVGGAGADAPEVYDDEDRDKMCKLIVTIKKPVLAFKILAATRKCSSQDEVRAAYRYAYQHIKPDDPVVVGFFPKYIDQIALGLQYAREALNLCTR